MSPTRTGALSDSFLSNDGFVPYRRRPATPTFGPMGCEDNKYCEILYSTSACLGVRDIGCGISPVGGNVPCFGMSVARHDPLVVHAIDGDQLRRDPRATVTVQSLAHFSLPVAQYDEPIAQLRGAWGIVGPNLPTCHHELMYQQLWS